MRLVERTQRLEEKKQSERQERYEKRLRATMRVEAARRTVAELIEQQRGAFEQRHHEREARMAQQEAQEAAVRAERRAMLQIMDQRRREKKLAARAAEEERVMGIVSRLAKQEAGIERARSKKELEHRLHQVRGRRHVLHSHRSPPAPIPLLLTSHHLSLTRSARGCG